MADYHSTHTGVKIDTNVSQVDTNTADIAALKARMDTAEGDIEGKADATSITTLSSQISGINAKISSAATSSNKLIDKAYVDSALSGKVDKVGGMCLSTNDFTNDYKTKLDGLPNGAGITLALSQKQDTLVSGSNIKTINGESVLGSGNIQAGEPYAVKYVPQTLTTEQKEQARANIGAPSISDVNSTNYVTVTTLPDASASTMGSIYLVGPDAQGNYNRYITQRSGDTYSWVNLGTTKIDMSDYMLKVDGVFLGTVVENNVTM